jgi:hypothetical protein
MKEVAPDHPVNSLPQELLYEKEKGKFKPKLTFEERCAVLGLVNHGVRRSIVAAAFDLDRRTVTHIVNDASPHYRNVRARYKEIGHTEFMQEYVTPEIVERVAKVKLEEVEAKEAVPVGAANPRSRSRAGSHIIQPDQCSYPHNIEIAWRDADGEKPEGWWFRDLNSSEPETWLNNGPESLATSSACLVAIYENLVDD